MSHTGMLLREPVERVWSRYEMRRREIEGLGWELADVYVELGGDGPRSSDLHRRFADFFNGNARAVMAGRPEEPKLEFWAGMPERAARLRDEARELLDAEATVEVDRRPPALQIDPRTRSLILAHNQIDAELYEHFRGLGEPDEEPPRSEPAGRRGVGVCVLGMSRSGTSLTARVLNLLGVDLGDESELMPPKRGNNPAGFWEHKGIANLNEEIFAALSDAPPPYLQGWRWPPPLAPGWERDARLDPLRRAAREVLRRGPAGSRLWGWKDPRNSLTLPFWQELVPEPRYVICVRHPLDVAASLQARDEMPREEALELWQRYTSAALDHTEGRPRIFVAYEAYFPGWERQVERLADFLGLPAPDELDRLEIGVNVEADLRHHRHDTGHDAELPDHVADLYARLVELCDR